MNRQSTLLAGLAALTILALPGCQDDPAGPPNTNPNDTNKTAALQVDDRGYPVITRVNMPVPLDASPQILVNHSGLDAGSSGENMLWDFSDLEPRGTHRWWGVDPAGTAVGNQYPGATVAEGDDASTIRIYLRTEDKYYIDLGLHQGSNGFIMVYSSPDTLFTFPFKFGSSHNSSGYGTFSGLFGQEIHRKTIGSKVADGYGTLKLPTGAFTRVLRVVSTQTVLDSNFRDGEFTTLITNNIKMYQWYDAKHRFPIFTIVEVTSSSGLDRTSAFYDGNAVPSRAARGDDDGGSLLRPVPVEQGNNTILPPGFGLSINGLAIAPGVR